MKIKKILTSQAEPGMVVAKDIYTFSNQMLIGENTPLTDRVISRLQFYSIFEISIYADGGNVNETRKKTPKISKSNTHLERIRSSEEYKEFNEEYTKQVDVLKDSLNQILISNDEIDIDALLLQMHEILSKSRNVIHLFDMLHSMRNYDDLTYVHSVNVSLICHVFGEWLKLKPEDIEILTLCGLFHDIGKLQIPQDIIEKPTALSEEEYKTMKSHTVKGYQLLKNRQIDERIKYAALMHHERCDGSGYPNHYHAKSINEFAKIVAIADVYDAMTSARVYRAPLCPFEVLHIFESEGLSVYDPKYLLIFFDGILQTYVMNTVRLSNGAEGKIIMINKNSLSQPVVQVGDEFIDLSKDKSLYIEAII